MYDNFAYQELVYGLAADRVRKLQAGTALYPELVHALAKERAAVARAGAASRARREQRGRGTARARRALRVLSRLWALPGGNS